MQMMIAPQRCSRTFLFLVALILGIFLFTASRLHAPSIPQSLLHFGFGTSHGTKALDVIQLNNGLVPVEPTTDQEKPKASKCSNPEIEHLRRQELALTESIVYTRRCIKLLRGAPDRDAVTNVSRSLITNKLTLNLDACSRVDLQPCDYLPLVVPPAYPDKDYRHLMFGVASKFDRLQSSLPSFAHWLSGSGAQLIVIVADANERGRDLNLSDLEEEYRRWGINATFMPPNPKDIGSKNDGSQREIPVEHHHFLVIRELVTAATPDTKWLGIVDDDTFFPSLFPLDAELARHDYTQRAWLGALSDDFSSIRVWGIMAFGGAGVFLSVPLAQAIAPLSEQCISEAATPSGDGILRDCIYAHTGTKLTVVPGLHQHDFRGDPSGFYESGGDGFEKSWYRAPLAAMASVTGVCGSCFLQRWRFGTNTILSNGYSVVQYADDILDTLDLSRVEFTWDDPVPNGHDYDFSYGPLRPPLGRDQKKSYRLVDVSVVDADGEQNGGGWAGRWRGKKKFRQLYIYRGKTGEEDDDGNNEASDDDDENKKPIMDEVIELLWDF
ncbi:glycosyltransferase family 31 protein [Podospora didyma]|uniref:Glycosyltransferase family 31 protein n=1 Tax=Podospora didyma TaxID=330526 RepID=A0AAE0NNR0_9PEZI|nr:glycosyltransferase family 31 protein [Podospora didyma]